MPACRTCGGTLEPEHRQLLWCTLVVYVCASCGRQYSYVDVAQRTPSARLPCYRLRGKPTRALWKLQREGELVVVADPEDGAMMVVPLAW